MYNGGRYSGDADDVMMTMKKCNCYVNVMVVEMWDTDGGVIM